MVYIDSSCLLKVLWNEAESAAVLEQINEQPAVIVSRLTELEALVQLKSAFLGGEYTRSRWHQFEAQLSALRNEQPYEFRALPADLFQTALRQHRNSGDLHCRPIDRLHLAAIEELGLSRLMTNDDRQAKAAKAVGFEVIQPGPSNKRIRS